MKRIIPLLLVLALLASCLTGCGGSKDKDKFYDDLIKFYPIADNTRFDLFTVLAEESAYMKAYGVNGEGHPQEIALYAAQHASGVDFNELGDAIDEMSALCDQLRGNKWGQENAQEIILDADLANTALQNMASCSMNPTGTGEEFQAKYGDFYDVAGELLQEINAFLAKQK